MSESGKIQIMTYRQHIQVANTFLSDSHTEKNNNNETPIWLARLALVGNPPQLWKHSLRRPDSEYSFSLSVTGSTTQLL